MRIRRLAITSVAACLTAWLVAPASQAQNFNDVSVAIADFKSSCFSILDQLSRQEASRIGYDNAMRNYLDSAGVQNGWIRSLMSSSGAGFDEYLQQLEGMKNFSGTAATLGSCAIRARKRQLEVSAGGSPTSSTPAPAPTYRPPPPPPPPPPPAPAWEPTQADLANIALFDRAMAAAKPVPKPMPKPAPKAPPPTFALLRNEGAASQCIDFTTRGPPTLTSDGGYWQTDFELINKCSTDVIVWYDFGEADKGVSPDQASIVSNSLPLVYGNRNIGWMKGTPPPLTFTPRNPDGTGFSRIPTGFSFHGSKLRNVDTAPGAYYVWMVSCPAFVDKTTPPVLQTLFVEDRGLRPIGRFACLPNGVEPF